jgi:hypothetical protein
MLNPNHDGSAFPISTRWKVLDHLLSKVNGYVLEIGLRLIAGKVVPLIVTASKPASLQWVLLDLELSQSEANQ